MKKLLYILFFISHLGHAMSIHDACRKGNAPEVKKLLASNADQLNERKNGGLPIHFAAYGCSTEAIKLLLDAKPELVNEPDARGNVPFNHVFMAILDWQEEVRKIGIVENIVKMGILQHRSSEKFEDAKAKKMRSFKATIDLFIERGARLDKPNNFGCTWDQMPGVDKELAGYARSIKLLQNK